MPLNPRNPTRAIAAIDNRIDMMVKNELNFGSAISITPDGKSVKVRLGGSVNLVEAVIMRDTNVSPGDHVMLARPKGEQQWVVLGAYDRSRVNAAGVTTTNHFSEIAPPNNFTGIDGDGMLIWVWEIPAQRPDLTFAIQVTDTDDTDFASATTYKRGGSHLMIAADAGTEKIARIRSIQTNFEKSAWSSSAQSTSIGSIEYGLYADLPTTPVGEYFAYDTQILYIADGNQWYSVGTGDPGGGGTTWDVDAAPASPGSIDDEFDNASIAAQWTEQDVSSKATWVESGDALRLTLAESAVDELVGQLVALPADDEYTAVVKVTLISTSLWTLPLTAGNTRRIGFGIGFSEDGTISSAFGTCGVYINRNQSDDGHSRRADAWSWTSYTVKTFGEILKTILSSNNYEWYFRIRKSLDDGASEWRVDASYDGLSWSNGVIWRDMPTSITHLMVFAQNRDADADLVVDYEFFRYRNQFDGAQDPIYGSSGSSQAFLDLTDTPGSYTSQSGKFVKVKSTEDGLEFGTVSGTGDMEKSVYDTNDDGLVDTAFNALRIGGLAVATGTSPSNGEVLLWDGGNSWWEPGTPAGGGDMLKSVYDANDDNIIDSAFNAMRIAGMAVASGGSDGDVLTWNAGGNQLELAAAPGAGALSLTWTTATKEVGPVTSSTGGTVRDTIEIECWIRAPIKLHQVKIEVSNDTAITAYITDIDSTVVWTSSGSASSGGVQTITIDASDTLIQPGYYMLKYTQDPDRGPRNLNATTALEQGLVWYGRTWNDTVLSTNMGSFTMVIHTPKFT